MINAITITAPQDVGMELAPANSRQAPEQGSEFAAVLNENLNADGQSEQTAAVIDTQANANTDTAVDDSAAPTDALAALSAMLAQSLATTSQPVPEAVEPTTPTQANVPVVIDSVASDEAVPVEAIAPETVPTTASAATNQTPVEPANTSATNQPQATADTSSQPTAATSSSESGVTTAAPVQEIPLDYFELASPVPEAANATMVEASPKPKAAQRADTADPKKTEAVHDWTLGDPRTSALIDKLFGKGEGQKTGDQQADPQLPNNAAVVDIDMQRKMGLSAQIFQMTAGTEETQPDFSGAIEAPGSKVKATAGTPAATAASDTASSFMLGATDKAPFGSFVREATPAAQASTEAAAPEVSQRIIDQVVREVTLRQFDGKSDLVVKLNPPELGALRVQITAGADGMTSQISASSNQVKGLIQAHLPALMTALSEAGVRMDQVSVSSGYSFDSMMQDAAYSSAQQRNNGSNHRSNGEQAYAVETGFMPIAAASAAAINGSAGYNWLA